MTPSARLQAAIEILDQYLAGLPCEQALTRWARASRFAGAKDRAAVRDHVFDCLRCLRSFAHSGGAMTGRGLVLGMSRVQAQQVDALFTGEGHAPAPLNNAERDFVPDDIPQPVALDCPDWLAPILHDSLGADFTPVMQAMRHRAPVFLRSNAARLTRDEAIHALQQDGIVGQPHPLASTAIEVVENPRRIRQSRAYLEGLVELQDAASQAVIAQLPDLRGLRVLDYCAGGGGKSLAMAALGANVTAHDVNPDRMRDLPARAARAGVSIEQTTHPTGAFDLVLLDVPCSGSGSWRRAPEGKWTLSSGRLEQLVQLQAQILEQATGFLREGGFLCYATCSMLDCENTNQISRFLAQNPRFDQVAGLKLTPLDGGDGFFAAVMRDGRI